MLITTLKLTFRSIFKNGIYSSIKIAGLIIAITSSILIFNFIKHELSTDKHITNISNKYRVLINKPKDNRKDCTTSGPLAEAIKQNIPEIRNYSQFYFNATKELPVKIIYDDKLFEEEKSIMVDNNFFDFFSVNIIKGSVNNFQYSANDIAISNSLAKKIFGNIEVIGKNVRLNIIKNHDYIEENHTVVAVFEDVPTHSSFNFNLISGLGQPDDSWGYLAYNLFVKLNNVADVKHIEKKLSEIEYINHQRGEPKEFVLQPYQNIYFHSEDIASMFSNTGSIIYLKILFSIASLILLLSSINYIIFDTAIQLKNQKSSGIQKVLGAKKIQISLQSLVDLAIHIFIASLVAALSISYLQNFFNQFVSPTRIIKIYTGFLDTLFLIAIVSSLSFLLLTLIKTILPKIYLPFYKKSLSASLRRENKFYQKLVIPQFLLFSIILIAGLLLIKQINFLKTKDIGLDLNNTMGIRSFGISNVNILKEELKNCADVKCFTHACSLPFEYFYGYEFKINNDPEKSINGQLILADNKFLETYDIELASGRNLNPSLFPKKEIDFYKVKDNIAEVIVNELFIKKANLSQPIGEIITFNGSKYEIVGIVKNFHTLSLYYPIRPTAILYDAPMIPDMLTAKSHDDQFTEMVKSIRKIYEKRFPHLPFMYKSYSFQTTYGKDISLSRLINFFGMIAMFISALGLFGLSLFVINSRTKEIGVRKVNGARIGEILSLLNVDFLKWVLVAFLLACPISWYVVTKWLQNFAYKTEMSWWVFALAGTISLIIALITVSWQSWRAASRNPVEALRYE